MLSSCRLAIKTKHSNTQDQTQERHLVVAALLFWEVRSLLANGIALELDHSSGRAVSLQPVMEMVLLDD